MSAAPDILARPASDHAVIFTPEARNMIRALYAADASDIEFAQLCMIAEARGLDPRLGHCYFVQRFDRARFRWKWEVQITIDGMRMFAERSGDYGGQDEPEWIGDGNGELELARVRVYRKSIDRPFVGVAHWREYVQVDESGHVRDHWARMPRGMLAKCAEALALRKAFPQLAQLYTPEEMMQADNDNAKRAPQLPIVLQRLVDDVSQFDGPTIEQLVTVWLDHKQAINTEAGGDDGIVRAAISEILQRAATPVSKNEFYAHVRAAEASRAHPLMKTFSKVLADAATTVDVVAAWRLHRSAIAKIVDRDRSCWDIAWDMACRRVGSLDTELRAPKKWLKEAIAKADTPATVPAVPTEAR